MSKTRRDFLRQTGCAALGAGAFMAGVRDFGLVNALAQTTPSDYRALVCVFLNGGNDGNNTVVPTDDRYTLYSNERAGAGLAVPAAGQPNGLLSLNGVPYGLNPGMAVCRSFFTRASARPVHSAPRRAADEVVLQSGAGSAATLSHSVSCAVAVRRPQDVTRRLWRRVADRATLNGAATFRR